MTLENPSASVQTRLQTHARDTKRPFQKLLQYYAMERFLYRLSKSPHRSRFILKGTLMLHMWKAWLLASQFPFEGTPLGGRGFPLAPGGDWEAK
jgi:hypothetical protein